MEKLIERINLLQEKISLNNKAMASTYDDCTAEQNAARLKYDDQVARLKNERRDLNTMMDKKLSDAAYAYNQRSAEIATKYKIRRMNCNEEISKAKTEISILKLKMYKDSGYEPDKD